MKKLICISAVIVAAAAISILAPFAFKHLSEYTAVGIATSVSPDGKYTAALDEVATQNGLFGSSKVRITVKCTENGEIIEIIEDYISNDGKRLFENNWNVKWNSDSVIITLIGEEQQDEIHTVMLAK